MTVTISSLITNDDITWYFDNKHRFLREEMNKTADKSTLEWLNLYAVLTLTVQTH